MGREDPGALSLAPGMGGAGLILGLSPKIKVSLRKGRRRDLPVRLCFPIPEG